VEHHHLVQPSDILERKADTIVYCIGTSLFLVTSVANELTSMSFSSYRSGMCLMKAGMENDKDIESKIELK